MSAAEVRHAQPYLTCLGFRFETDDGVIVFSGDTRPCDEVIELARGADLLVMEAVALAGRQWEGSLLAESDTAGCATVAAAAGVKRLLVNHQPPWLDEPQARTQAIKEISQIYDGPVLWGEELLEVQIGPEGSGG